MEKGAKKERSTEGKNKKKKQAISLLNNLKIIFFFFAPLLLFSYPPYFTVRFFEATSINALTEGSDTSKNVLG